MNTRDIMQPHVITADHLVPVKQVAAHMIVSRISGFPITNHEGVLVGIVTELDLIRLLRSGKSLEYTLVDEVMTRDVITVDAEESVDRLMEILEEERIIRLPVVSNGELVGIVSRGDVLKAELGPGLGISA